jgi:precorrin-2 dehydrogenase/sirohydrochlorin ferrochelatase
MINIKDKIISVVGGGAVALRKVNTLLQYKASIKVISPEFVEDFKCISDKVTLIKEYYSEALISDSFIVVAATSSREINKSIAEFCRESKILCNIADDLELSDFIVPSSIKRGDLVISVSTNGKSPALASKIKKELEEKYGEDYETYINILGDIRVLLQEKCHDVSLRKKILNEILYLSYEELLIRRDELEGCSRV